MAASYQNSLSGRIFLLDSFKRFASLCYIRQVFDHLSSRFFLIWNSGVAMSRLRPSRGLACKSTFPWRPPKLFCLLLLDGWFHSLHHLRVRVSIFTSTVFARGKLVHELSPRLHAQTINHESSCVPSRWKEYEQVCTCTPNIVPSLARLASSQSSHLSPDHTKRPSSVSLQTMHKGPVCPSRHNV